MTAEDQSCERRTLTHLRGTRRPRGALLDLSVGIGCPGAVVLSAIRRRSSGAVCGMTVNRERALGS